MIGDGKRQGEKEALPRTIRKNKVTYQLQHRKCGKWKCDTCLTTPGHGPYWYAFWHEGGKARSLYIGKDLTAARVLERLANRKGKVRQRKGEAAIPLRESQ